MLSPSESAAIGAGYREACDVAKARLEELTVDNSKDETKFRQDLLNIAKTTLRWGAIGLWATVGTVRCHAVAREAAEPSGKLLGVDHLPLSHNCLPLRACRQYSLMQNSELYIKTPTLHFVAQTCQPPLWRCAHCCRCMHPRNPKFLIHQPSLQLMLATRSPSQGCSS